MEVKEKPLTVRTPKPKKKVKKEPPAPKLKIEKATPENPIIVSFS